MSYPLFPDKAFPPGRNEACFCQSGERFKHCCGAQTAERLPPFGVGILENFLTPEQCSAICTLAADTPGKLFMARDSMQNLVPDKNRVTEWINFQEQDQQIMDQLVARAFAEQVIPRTGQNIEWYEEPQLLRYTPGGYYRYHSDAYYLVPESAAWRKVVDRDISILLYLNNDYEGGELEFKRFSYTLKPRAGMLVWFPSDVRYEHMAKPVISGERYVLVSWAAASSLPRVQTERAKRSIDWLTREKKAAPES